ncbi:hypothetical protein [Sphingomonas sp. GM_Shp_1]|uniref:hypothetical protein n=1 Tax=Sphingomonas sp. GM_Shp_1 TaxID=2937381 RepID=UPI00226B88EF|nr:hypothetical protein [Sphingomonas sp. GM_Shp_1]
MSDLLARRIVALAVRCLPPQERFWGRAMQAELEEVAAHGPALPFALGCLMTAWRRLPLHRNGRALLASHVLTIGLILPFAAFHVQCALRGAYFLLSGRDPYYAALTMGSAAQQARAVLYRDMTPAVTVLLLLLGLVHMFLAWTVVQRRWRRAAMLWLMAGVIAAATVIVIAPIATPMGIVVQCLALGIEMLAIPVLARWRIAPTPCP